MYTKVLVPVDGSKRAEKILAHVEALAQKFGSQIVLLQVVEPLITTFAPTGMVPYYDEQMTTDLIDAAKGYVANTRAALQAQGFHVTGYVENGPIVATILQVAEQENVDLIALASHGRTGLARAFYGSVAAGILNQADRPLLLIRAQA